MAKTLWNCGIQYHFISGTSEKPGTGGKGLFFSEEGVSMEGIASVHLCFP